MSEVVAWLVSVVGHAAVVGGAAGFLARLLADAILQSRRAKQERELQDRCAQQERELEALKDQYQTALEQLRSRIERTIVAHRGQFEVEFKATQKVWQALAHARSLMEGLRPMHTTAPVGETDEQALERFRERLTEFIDARNDLVRTLNGQRPFLAPAVFAAADQVRWIIVAEAQSATLAEPKAFSPYWYERGEKHLDELAPVADHLVTVIRHRLSKMLV